MINKVTLLGHAGNDPESRTLETGAQVARVSLATNESYKDKSGEWQTTTEWHNLIMWRDLAERAVQQIKKGTTLYIEGKIQSRKYTDKDGVEKSITDIVANTFRVLDKREKGPDNRMPEQEPASHARNSQEAGAQYQESETAQHAGGGHTYNEPPIQTPPPSSSDDLPF